MKLCNNCNKNPADTDKQDVLCQFCYYTKNVKMAKRLSGNLNLDMIKEAIAGGVQPFEGKKGKYVPVTVWINDEVDQFGNIASLSIYNKDKQSATYLGNLKEFDGPAPNAPGAQASTEAQTPDLPF